MQAAQIGNNMVRSLLKEGLNLATLSYNFVQVSVIAKNIRNRRDHRGLFLVAVKVVNDIALFLSADYLDVMTF